MLEIEAVAVEGGGSRIVQHGLIGKLDTEDISQDGRCFPCRDSEGDVEGEDETEDVLGVMDSGQIDSGSVRG